MALLFFVAKVKSENKRVSLHYLQKSIILIKSLCHTEAFMLSVSTLLKEDMLALLDVTYFKNKSHNIIRRVDFCLKFRNISQLYFCSASCENSITKELWLIVKALCGARNRNRTGTVSPPQDFKSCASACSATRANSF